MSEVEAELKTQVQDTDLVKTMIELLDKYREDLPGELVESLDKLADCDAIEIGYDEVVEKAGDKSILNLIYEGLPENVVGKPVFRINPILKRVTYDESGEGKGLVIQHCYPEKFKATVNGNLICEW